MVPELIVVTGPPGAGKSTVSRILAGRFDPSALVEGDAFFAMIEQGYIEPWTGPAHRQNGVVVAAAAAAAGRIAQGGYTVVFDGVIGPWFLDTFLTATGLEAIHYVMLLPPEAVCLERVASRTGHGFSDPDATRHMYRAFARTDSSEVQAISSTDPPEVLASTIADLHRSGALRLTVGAG